MEDHDLTGLIMYDEMFHTEIVSISSNKLLMNLNKQVIEANKKYRAKSFQNDKVYRHALPHHQKILECFQKGLAQEGMLCMQAHLEEIIDDIAAITDEDKK